MSGLVGSRRWEVLPHDDAAERELAVSLGVTPLVARVLVARGMRDVNEARRFLAPSLERDWEPPLDIPGMREACDRVEAALVSGEQIAVYGDFDVDGMSATSLLTLALRRLGGRAEPYIPHRFGEGYGLSREALTRVMEGCNPSLVITVDNGIAAAREVEWLVSQGVDVVITDHHEPGELVPQGVPVTDPKLSPECASRELAGAGVALKMVCELGRRLGQPDLWREFSDLATLGTVSDMMTLTGENRSLVADGMARLRRGTRPGIVALAATAGTDLSTLTSDALPFSLVPRLNAAGRMGTTDTAFDLLLTDDPTEAAVLARSLEQINADRRETESQLTDAAEAMVDATYDGGRVIVVAGEGWHEGVKGIVASRIVGRYHVPAIVFTIVDGVARGSGRSVGSVDLFHAVEQCSDLLVRFGGHEGAVGVTCEVDKLDAFRERLSAIMGALPAEQFETRGEVAALVGLEELTVEGIGALEVLQPFGQGNKKPLFGVRGVCMRSRIRVGAAGNHLRFVATDGVSSVPAILFRAPDIDRAVACEEVVDLVCEAVNETWQGRTKPKLMVRDIVYRSAAAAGEVAPADACAQGRMVGAAGRSALRAAGERAGADASGAVDGAADAGEMRSRRERHASLEAGELTHVLRRAMVGEHDFLPVQRRVLDMLDQGRSTLAVMATGRGKSLIFHVHAARRALLANEASLFVYPLRALVSDQAFHLVGTLANFGLSCAVLTGETSESERERVYARLAAGTLDVVLTTPEYLAIHVDRLAEARRVGFVVFDEAHHVGGARGGNRAAYLEMPSVLRRLNDPVVLATTATATSAVAREACGLLGIDEANVVVDSSMRPNLAVRDCRELRDRDTALASLVSRAEKCVVYVNSREQTVSLARMLRRTVSELGERIAFYNAAMTRADRLAVERAFRDGRLTCIVSTSAFGEGVNLPDIRHVVLYHMPFGQTEFNQMSGRAGRDGAPATVHLLFCGNDARINESILEAGAPSRADMAALYRVLRAHGASGAFTLDVSALVAEVAAMRPQAHVSEAAVLSGIGVFGELGLLDTSGYGDDVRVSMTSDPSRVELLDSVRYAEGVRVREAFASFGDRALSMPAEVMLEQVRQPIVPDFGCVVDE